MLRRPYADQTLAALDRDEFMGDPGLIRFVRNASGRVMAFSVTNVRDAGIEFVRAADRGVPSGRPSKASGAISRP
jgi:hypothetical protein